MKIIYNNLIPFKGFIAINLFGIIFVRNEYKNYINYDNKYDNRNYIINHESIHTKQIKELGYIFFYIWYFIEWILRLPFGNAYCNISFEREAYANEKNGRYLQTRKHYSFLKYIFKH